MTEKQRATDSAQFLDCQVSQHEQIVARLRAELNEEERQLEQWRKRRAAIRLEVVK